MNVMLSMRARRVRRTETTAPDTANALKTQALGEVHEPEAPNLRTTRSKSNSGNSQRQSDLERTGAIGGEAGIRTRSKSRFLSG
jgi:L-asparaginase/Glu-tRNA(Gln) amidotransferase subunit D